MKLYYQYMAVFFNFSPTSSHLHPLQVENCVSNSRLVVDEYDNGKFRLERVNISPWDGKDVTLKSDINTISTPEAIFYIIEFIFNTSLTPTTLKYIFIDHGDQRYIFSFEITVNVLLALSPSFEYICYGSTTITHF